MNQERIYVIYQDENRVAICDNLDEAFAWVKKDLRQAFKNQIIQWEGDWVQNGDGVHTRKCHWSDPEERGIFAIAPGVLSTEYDALGTYTLYRLSEDRS